MKSICVTTRLRPRLAQTAKTLAAQNEMSLSRWISWLVEIAVENHSFLPLASSSEGPIFIDGKLATYQDLFDLEADAKKQPVTTFSTPEEAVTNLNCEINEYLKTHPEI